MNCDRVFEILTRGPFPTGDASDAAVEQHLRACHECRQLAEALRPAVELFHEAIEPGDGDDLPGYRGELKMTDYRGRSATTEAVMRQVGQLSSPRERWNGMTPIWTWLNFGRLVAATALGAGLVLLLNSFTELADADPNTPIVQIHEPVGAEIGPLHPVLKINYPNEAGFAALRSLNLRDVCKVMAGEIDPHSKTAEFQCCKQCHADGAAVRPTLPASKKIEVAQCFVCHREQ